MCGTTSDQCWTSMTGTSNLVHEPVTKFAMTNLNAAIHKSDVVMTGGNNMPLENVDSLNSAYLFSPADLACIGGWVTAGGKND
jgi:methyl coenzyme M reductase subunit C